MTDTDSPTREWDLLLSQWVITLNLLRNSRVHPALSAYAYLFGPYNFNKSTMAPPGTRVILHEKPGNRICPLWHTGLVYWSVTWPLQMYAVLHSHNWNSKNHRYPPIYPKGICFPQNNNIRLYTAGHCRYNCNDEGPPRRNFFLILWWCYKKCDKSDFPHPT